MKAGSSFLPRESRWPNFQGLKSLPRDNVVIATKAQTAAAIG